MTDNADELLGSGDLEGSPVDSDEHIDVMGYARSSQSLSQGYVDQPKYNMSQSRSEPPFSSLDRSNGQFDSRVPYGPSSNSTVERFMQPLAQPRHLLQQPDANYPYSQSQSQNQVQSYNDVAPQGWPPRVERLQPTWLDRQSGSMGGHRQAQYSPSTPPSSTWSNSPNGPNTSSSSPNFFPTLNTPFYPGQPSVADYQSISSPSHSHPMSTPSPIYEPVSQAQTNMMSKEYAPRVYSSTGAIQLDNTYPPPSSRTPLSYSQRSLPRVQTTMDYVNSQPSSSSSSSGHGSVAPGFWSRE